MRDFSTGRRRSSQGFDRIVMAVAATFLSVAATGAHAQSTSKSPADLPIDAAVPLPEPANVPPPTINDFKLEAAKPDTAAAATPAPAKKDEAAAPATTATVPPAATATAPVATTPTAAATAEAPKTEPAKAA